MNKFNKSDNEKYYNICRIHYSAEVESSMQELYGHLSEKEKRLYAAVEALKLPHGGIGYVSDLLGCDRKTVRRGIKELKNRGVLPGKRRNRKKGGGRKQTIKKIRDIDAVFLDILKNHTAGNPMDEKVIWTDLTVPQLIERLKNTGIRVGKHVVKKLLKKHGYKKRKMCKSIKTGSCENRNEQFENISFLKVIYEMTGNPVISIDTKKKEFIGNLYRNGKVYTQETIEVYDHDFPYLADGIVIPHAVYDLKNNSAYVSIGISRDTSEFACDSIKIWWNNRGRHDYPDAESVLILADSGGSNSCRHYIFKEDIQKLADEIGIEIRIAHYPPYTSKWNPIEHRLFPHITRALEGVVFKSHELVKTLIERTTTKKGLKVKAEIIYKAYETGRKYAENFKETMRIVFDEYLGKWNYRAVPFKS